MRPFLRLAAVLAFLLSANYAWADTFALARFTFVPSGTTRTDVDFTVSASTLQPFQPPSGAFFSSFYLPAYVRIGTLAENTADYFFLNQIELYSGDAVLSGLSSYFTGGLAAPSFTPGTYSAQLSIFGLQTGVPSQEAGLLTITGIPAPEPSSIALLGTGLLGTLGVYRRRKSS